LGALGYALSAGWQFPLFNRLEEGAFITAAEGQATVEHLVEDSACAVDVDFVVVELSAQDLWSHVKGCSCERPHHLVLAELARETKVCYLDAAILEEDIGRFEVSMHDFIVMHGGYSEEDLFEDFESLGFGQAVVLVNIICQAASLAVL
jgi:hypothetical protein